MWDNFHRTWIYGLIILTAVSCVSCSGKKPTLKGLLDEMSSNCQNGPQTQKAEPASEPNDEIQAKIEVHCFPPPARVVYGT